MTAQAEVLVPNGERVLTPRVGDVIVCEAFMNGWRRLVQPDVAEDGPIWVTDAPERLRQMTGMPRQDCTDPSRATAQFVVEECTVSRHSCVRWTDTVRGGGYGNPFTFEEEKHAYATQVTARRLKTDGSYDPEGECVRFDSWGEGPGNHYPRINDCLAAARRSGNPTLVQTVIDTPIYKLRTMQRIVRFV